MWICVLSSVSGIYLTTNHLLPRIPWFLFPVTWHRENNYQSLQRTYLSITGCHHSFLGKAEVFNIQILIRLSFSKSKWMLENEMPIFSVYVMEIFCELKLDHNTQNSKHVAECIQWTCDISLEPITAVSVFYDFREILINKIQQQNEFTLMRQWKTFSRTLDILRAPTSCS